jgi:hypothetical protein
VKILVACETSGRVRDALRARGHKAISCDLLPSETPGPHIQGDVRNWLTPDWDMLIAFPPCPYLCSSGLHWNSRRPGRAEKTEEALAFVRLLLEAPIGKIALENPIGCISTRIRKPSQIIQPYQFGDDASKATCLWLVNLPLLAPTEFAPPGSSTAARDGETRPTAARTGWARARPDRHLAQRRTQGSPGQWLPSGARKKC